MPHAAECYALLLDTVSLRFARPDGNPVDRVASHFGLARPEFDAASRAYSAWRDTLGDDPDPAVLAAALAARPAVERAVGYWIDKVVPARDPDPAVEPLRHAAAAAIRLSAAESAADAGNAERFLDLLDESARDPDPWVRGALPPRVSDCVACVELSPAQRARLVAAYRALATDADDRVRAAALAHAPAGFPTPAPDDPSPRVRAAHPQTTEAELFAIARHPELEVASSVRWSAALRK